MSLCRYELTSCDCFLWAKLCCIFDLTINERPFHIELLIFFASVAWKYWSDLVQASNSEKDRFSVKENLNRLYTLCFAFLLFIPCLYHAALGGLWFTSQENGYGTETILFALSCGCLRKVVYLRGVEQIMWTLKRCGALPLAFRHAPLLLEFSLGLEKRKATLNCFNLGFFSWLSAVSFPFFKTQCCRQRVWRIMCGRNTWAQFSLKYV